jgi:hypothetical protein
MYSRNLVEDDARIAEIVASARRVAVLGARAEPEKAAFFVPEYLQRHGIRIFPVPVGADAPAEILGVETYRSLAEVPGPIDVVDVFRRPKEVEAHVPELLAARPRCVWMQLGIHSERAAEALARAGILVVQDRCLMAEHRRVVRAR